MIRTSSEGRTPDPEKTMRFEKSGAVSSCGFALVRHREVDGVSVRRYNKQVVHDLIVLGADLYLCVPCHMRSDDISRLAHSLSVDKQLPSYVEIAPARRFLTNPLCAITLQCTFFRTSMLKFTCTIALFYLASALHSTDILLPSNRFA